MKKTVLLAISILVVVRAMGQYRIGLTLPFSGTEGRTSKMVEFYRGVLMAVDSMSRAYGANIDVVALDCGETAQEMSNLLARHDELGECQVIIGPQSSKQVPTLSRFCKNNDVRLVIPFANVSFKDVDARAYVVSLPMPVYNDEAGMLFLELFKDANVVSFETYDNTVGASYIQSSIVSKCSNYGVGVARMNITMTSEEMRTLMSPDKRNVLIVNGASLVAVNRVIAILDAFCAEYPDYRITLVGNVEWQNYMQQHLHNFYKYDVYVPVTYFRNALSTANVQFENSYIRSFSTPMLNSTPRFAPMGFDVAWFFMNAIRLYGTEGDEIEKHFDALYSTQHPLQHALLFRPTLGTSWENRACRFVHYSPSGAIELLSR